MPLVVIVTEVSIRIALRRGMPTAIGSIWLEHRADATERRMAASDGSELATIVTMPALVPAGRKVAMWWLRRIATVPMPYARARLVASATARAVSHTPGRRCPSHTTAAPRSDSTSGSPAEVIRPAAISLR